MTLKWSIDQSKSRLTFGKLFPMTGNTYEILISGKSLGATYVFYVMDDSGERCLAASIRDPGTDSYTIAFNTTDLRMQFEKNWHEIRTFHTIVSDGTNTIAEGDLPVVWNPVWTEPGVGRPYSMKGEKGDQGEKGERGEQGPEGRPSHFGYCYDETTHKYHKLITYTNKYGEKMLDVDPVGVDSVPVPFGFGTPTASVTELPSGATPTAAVTASGPNSAKVFAFAFGLPQGVVGADGVSPAVSTEEITGGHRVKIADKTHPAGSELTFDVMNGEKGDQGEPGEDGTAVVHDYSTGSPVAVYDFKFAVVSAMPTDPVAGVIYFVIGS